MFAEIFNFHSKFELMRVPDTCSVIKDLQEKCDMYTVLGYKMRGARANAEKLTNIGE